MQVDQGAEPKTVIPKRRKTPQTAAIDLVKAINRLLADVYSEPVRLSQVLKKSGINQQDIDLLQTDDLMYYLTQLVQNWVACWYSILPEECITILVNHYSLNSGAIDLVVSNLSSHSPTEKKLLMASLLSSLQQPKNQATLERIAIAEANTIMEERVFEEFTR